MLTNYRSTIAHIFAASFHAVAVLLLGAALYQLACLPGAANDDLMAAFIKAINSLVISLAMYELGTGVSSEYAAEESQHGDFLGAVRKAITRFVGTVVIALVLESLIMIIKYSQLDLAGNLIYPMGMVIATACLLLSLGVFLRLSANPGDAERAAALARDAAAPVLQRTGIATL